MEVCPLSRGMMLPPSAPLNPYPSDYRTAFAFSISRTRSPIGFACAPLSPHGGGYGLTMFRMNDRIGLGPLYSPVTGKCILPVPMMGEV
jgi:hypothetical protein